MTYRIQIHTVSWAFENVVVYLTGKLRTRVVSDRYLGSRPCQRRDRPLLAAGGLRNGCERGGTHEGQKGW